MNLDERIDYFCKNYDLVFYDTNFRHGKKFIGEKQARKCRFCSEKSVTFKTRAHAIPEFLGNKRYFSYEECDACNKCFSESLEDNLDKFTKPYRIIAKIKGKNKIPAYRSRDKNTWFGFKAHNQLFIEDVINSGFIDVKPDEKKISMRFKLEPYLPTAAYKCLVKIAISLLPKFELSAFQRTIKWIRHSDHSIKILNPQIVFYKYIPGFLPAKDLLISIIRRKANSKVIPYSYMILVFGNFVYQLIVPSQNDFVDGNSVAFKYYSYPSPWELNGIPLKEKKFDLSGHEITREEERIINFTCENIEKFDNEKEMDSV